MKSETDSLGEVQGSRTHSLENPVQQNKNQIQQPGTLDQLKVEKFGSQTIQTEEEEEDEREEVERILQLEPKDRTSRNITTLTRFFEGNRFFRQQSEMFEEKTIQYLYRNLRFCELKPRQQVFQYGDEGELFYIVMEGEVVIKTPAPDTLEDDQCTPEGLLIFLIEYFHEIQWKLLRDGERVRNLFVKELEAVNI